MSQTIHNLTSEIIRLSLINKNIIEYPPCEIQGIVSKYDDDETISNKKGFIVISKKSGEKALTGGASDYYECNIVKGIKEKAVDGDGVIVSRQFADSIRSMSEALKIFEGLNLDVYIIDDEYKYYRDMPPIFAEDDGISDYQPPYAYTGLYKYTFY